MNQDLKTYFDEQFARITKNQQETVFWIKQLIQCLGTQDDISTSGYGGEYDDPQDRIQEESDLEPDRARARTGTGWQ